MPVVLVDYYGKTRVDWAASKIICRGCPVRLECLSYALQLGALEGVWGGLAPIELRFALGLDAQGDLWTYTREDVKCPYCRASTTSEPTSKVTAIRKCTKCRFTWVRSEINKPKRTRRIRRAPE